jgi:hypothetical protein
MESRRLGMLVSAVGMMLAAIALLAPAAFATSTAPGYERFAGCPSPEEDPEVFLCQRQVVTGGHFQMGSKDVPITEPITLVGGVTFEGEVRYNSKGGLSHSRERIPGGLVGLTGLEWLTNVLSLEALEVYAVTELAGAPFLVAGEEVILPIKVHLENPTLGNNCYVGTNKNPITLHLIMGTTNPPAPNKPISGTEPVEGESGLEGVLLLEKGVFVDNSFAAPGASGCGLNLGLLHVAIDGLVDIQSGLPSAAGHNETKQNFNLEIATPETIYP